MQIQARFRSRYQYPSDPSSPPHPAPALTLLALALRRHVSAPIRPNFVAAAQRATRGNADGLPWQGVGVLAMAVVLETVAVEAQSCVMRRACWADARPRTLLVWAGGRQMATLVVHEVVKL